MNGGRSEGCKEDRHCVLVPSIVIANGTKCSVAISYSQSVTYYCGGLLRQDCVLPRNDGKSKRRHCEQSEAIPWS